MRKFLLLLVIILSIAVASSYAWWYHRQPKPLPAFNNLPHYSFEQTKVNIELASNEVKITGYMNVINLSNEQQDSINLFLQEAESINFYHGQQKLRTNITKHNTGPLKESNVVSWLKLNLKTPIQPQESQKINFSYSLLPRDLYAPDSFWLPSLRPNPSLYSLHHNQLDMIVKAPMQYTVLGGPDTKLLEDTATHKLYHFSQTIPWLVVYDHQAPKHLVGDFMILGDDIPSNILKELQASYQWCKSSFGQLSTTPTTITQVPGQRSYAFPGTILLATESLSPKQLPTLATQLWWGNAVSGDEALQSFISNTMPAYTAMLYELEEHDNDVYHQKLALLYNELQHPVTEQMGLVEDDKFLDASAKHALTVAKGSWGLHSLKGIIGEASFKNGLQSLYKLGLLNKVTLQDVISAFKPSHPKVKDFITDWFLEPSLPEFRVNKASVSVSEDKHLLHIEATNTSSIFAPIDILVQGEETSKSITLYPGKQKMVAKSVEINFIPVQLIIDPHNKIAQKNENNNVFTELEYQYQNEMIATQVQALQLLDPDASKLDLLADFPTLDNNKGTTYLHYEEENGVLSIRPLKIQNQLLEKPLKYYVEAPNELRFPVYYELREDGKELWRENFKTANQAHVLSTENRIKEFYPSPSGRFIAYTVHPDPGVLQIFDVALHEVTYSIETEEIENNGYSFSGQAQWHPYMPLITWSGIGKSSQKEHILLLDLNGHINTYISAGSQFAWESRGADLYYSLTLPWNQNTTAILRWNYNSGKSYYHTELPSSFNPVQLKVEGGVLAIVTETKVPVVLSSQVGKVHKQTLWILAQDAQQPTPYLEGHVLINLCNFVPSGVIMSVTEEAKVFNRLTNKHKTYLLEFR